MLSAISISVQFALTSLSDVLKQSIMTQQKRGWRERREQILILLYLSHRTVLVSE